MYDNKPWLLPFLEKLSGFAPIDQAFGMALAALADKDGFIEAIEYEDLTGRACISRDLARKMLQSSTLVSVGLIERIPRTLNGRPLSPSVKLRVG